MTSSAITHLNELPIPELDVRAHSHAVTPLFTTKVKSIIRARQKTLLVPVIRAGQVKIAGGFYRRRAIYEVNRRAVSTALRFTE